jgi:hypothetical protein
MRFFSLLSFEGYGSLRECYQLYHNFIRPHETLDGKTPSEACGITIEGKNKWKTLIENASKKS